MQNLLRTLEYRKIRVQKSGKEMRKEKNEYFVDLYRELENNPEYWLAALKVQVTETISKLMKKNCITQAELARRMKISRTYVSKILQAKENLTLKMISKIFFHLGYGISSIDFNLLTLNEPQTSRNKA